MKAIPQVKTTVAVPVYLSLNAKALHFPCCKPEFQYVLQKYTHFLKVFSLPLQLLISNGGSGPSTDSPY